MIQITGDGLPGANAVGDLENRLWRVKAIEATRRQRNETPRNSQNALYGSMRLGMGSRAGGLAQLVSVEGRNSGSSLVDISLDTGRKRTWESAYCSYRPSSLVCRRVSSAKGSSWRSADSAPGTVPLHFIRRPVVEQRTAASVSHC